MEIAQVLWNTLACFCALNMCFCLRSEFDNDTERGLYNNQRMLQSIQQIILNKLGLNEPPTIKFVKPPLQYLNSFNHESPSSRNIDTDLEEEDEEDDQETDSRAALFSEIDKSGNFYPNGVRFYFHLSPSILNASSVELWLYKNNSVDTLTLTQIFYNPPYPSMALRGMNVTGQRTFTGWIRLEILQMCRLSLDENYGFLDLEVSCGNDCLSAKAITGEKSHRPFLIHVSRNRKSRSKRDLECVETNNQSCRRERLYISFRELGFDSWIFYPEGAEMNYCTGSCFNEIGMGSTTYSSIIMAIISNNRTLAESLGLKLSCTPSVMASLMVIYIVDNGTLTITNQTKMIVEECNCA